MFVQSTKKETIVSFYDEKNNYCFHANKIHHLRHAADPAQLETALRGLGENLKVARKRRGSTLVAFAQRMQVSVATLRKMERGDPTVSVAISVQNRALARFFTSVRPAAPETVQSNGFSLVGPR